jgi:hypothetical protein
MDKRGNRLFVFAISALSALSLLVLLGCSNPFTVEGRLEDYLYRVRNTTGISPAEPDFEVSALERYPRKRDRTWDLDEARVGLLDYLALGGCELQQLVSERNSGLGKVMQPSQTLLYEHHFVVQAEDCIALLRNGSDKDKALSRELQEVLSSKRADLPKVYWNATFGSPEFEKMFSLANGPLPIWSGEDASPAVMNSLNYFVSLEGRLGRPEIEIDSSDLEQHYHDLQLDRYGGRLLRSVQLLTLYLEAVAVTLEGRLEEGPVCPVGRLSEEGEILQTVFREIYAPDIQLYVSRVHHKARAWWELTDRLANSPTSQMPPGFQAYYDGQIRMDREEGPWLRFEHAIRHHAAAWQAVLDECDMALGE